MGGDERWIVVFLVCFGLKVGIKIKHAKLNKSLQFKCCSSCKQILFNCEIINHTLS